MEFQGTLNTQNDLEKTTKLKDSYSLISKLTKKLQCQNGVSAGIKTYTKINGGLSWWLSSKESTCDAGDLASISGLGRLGKGMATHSSIFAWRVPRTEEPGGLQSMGLQRVRHD